MPRRHLITRVSAVTCACENVTARDRHKRCTTRIADDQIPDSHAALDIDCTAMQSHARDVMSQSAAHATSPLGLSLRQGVAAAQARDFERARELLQHVTTETPNDVIAWYWLAIASPSADVAIPCLRRVLAIDADHAPAREALALLLIAEARAAAGAGNREEARAGIAEATQLTPDLAAPWQAMAELATSQVERIDALRRLVTLAPEDSGRRTQLRQALLGRAVIIASTDRDEARSRFREAAALNPLDVRIWQALANLAESEEERLNALRELLRVAPDHEQGRSAFRTALIGYARTLAAAGNIDASLACWRETLEVTGGDVEAWLGLAATTTDQDEAGRAIQSAYDRAPEDPRAVAAFEALHGPRVDPAQLPAPGDAFARFEAESPSPSPRQPDAAGLDIDDSLFDALATLPQMAAAPTPPVVTAAATLAETFAPPPAPAVERPPVDAAPQASAADAPVVMVVDDSATIRKILGLTLERAGYRVVVEANGTSALERLRDLVPQLVLLDIAMPDLDGYEVCKRIKQDPRTQAVPVIMLSGKGAFFDKVKGHMAGATEYLTKPFETPSVLAVVNSHCHVEAQHG